MSYICYILRSLNPKYFNRTYTGITNNSTRRLRQHNGELVKGAHSVISIRPLTYFIKITGLTKNKALSIERTMHNMKRKNRKYGGLVGSLLCIGHLIESRTIKAEDVIYCKLAGEQAN
jgi:predicted GIY-YIG superfamily endonuclease